jgi:hypothetical protein
METRLIIAYSLIAIMVAIAAFGIFKLSQNKAKLQRRDSGNGDHMRDNAPVDGSNAAE